MPFSDGIWWDPDEKLFKMWYMAGYCGATCYATSKDGMNWVKPKLDILPGCNIVHLSGQRDSGTVWMDLEAKDPRKKYKMFIFHRSNWQSAVYSSPDGIHWSEPTWNGPNWDRRTIFYNPFRKVWVYSLRAQMYPQPWNYDANPPPSPAEEPDVIRNAKTCSQMLNGKEAHRMA